MQQLARQQLAEQSAEGPVRLVLEAGDQAVDGKGVAPGRLHPAEVRRAAQAVAARRAGVARQWQGAARTTLQQPGQLAFAGRADRRAAVGEFIAEQALLVADQPVVNLQY